MQHRIYQHWMGNQTLMRSWFRDRLKLIPSSTLPNLPKSWTKSTLPCSHYHWIQYRSWYRVSNVPDIAIGSLPARRYVYLLMSKKSINTSCSSVPGQQIESVNPRTRGRKKGKYVYLWSFLFGIVSEIFRHRTLESLSVKSLKRGTFLIEKAVAMKGKPNPCVPPSPNYSSSHIPIILFRWSCIPKKSYSFEKRPKDRTGGYWLERWSCTHWPKLRWCAYRLFSPRFVAGTRAGGLCLILFTLPQWHFIRSVCSMCLCKWVEMSNWLLAVLIWWVATRLSHM